VHLHWELTPRGYGDSMRLRDVRSRLERVHVGATEVSTLGPEDTLLYLCLRGTRHGWVALGWLVDLAELVRGQPRLDWDEVVLWSRRPGCRRSVQLGLHLAHRLLDAPVPDDVLGVGARDPRVSSLVGRVESAFRLGPSASRRARWLGRPGSVWFRATESRGDRLRHLGDRLLVPRPADYGWVSLPAWAGAGYFLVRPLRLAAKLAGFAGRD
jgi:hypothetical protein